MAITKKRAAKVAAKQAFAPRAGSPKRQVVSLSVDFELNTTNGLRKVVFGLEKDTVGEEVTWQIHFTLFERAKRTDPFGDPLVKLDVKLKTALFKKADTLAQSQPSAQQSAQLVGPVAEDAKAVKDAVTPAEKALAKADFDESSQGVIG